MPGKSGIGRLAASSTSSWRLMSSLIRGIPVLQVWFDVALEGFVGLSGDESLAEDAVAVNDVRDGARDIGLDVESGNARAWFNAAFDERHAGKFGELRLLLVGLVGDCDDDEAVFCVALLEALKHGHFLTAGRAPGGPKIEDHNLATVVRKGAGGFVSNKLEFELRHDFIGILENGFQRSHFSRCPAEKSDRFVDDKDSDQAGAQAEEFARKCAFRACGDKEDGERAEKNSYPCSSLPVFDDQLWPIHG